MDSGSDQLLSLGLHQGVLFLETDAPAMAPAPEGKTGAQATSSTDFFPFSSLSRSPCQSAGTWCMHAAVTFFSSRRTPAWRSPRTTFVLGLGLAVGPMRRCLSLSISSAAGSAPVSSWDSSRLESSFRRHLSSIRLISACSLRSRCGLFFSLSRSSLAPTRSS